MKANFASKNLLLAGKIFFGIGLAVMVVFLFTGLREDDPIGFGHGGGDQGRLPEQAVSSVPPANLTAFEQAQANGASLAVEGAVDPVVVYEQPVTDAAVVKSFPLKGEVGETITFMVLEEMIAESGDAWYKVQAPMRPNGTTGWVQGGQVTPLEIPYRIHIDLSDFRLDVFQQGQQIKSYPIGLGRQDTPTPTGQYYLTVKMRPPDPNTVYGALAFGVSAFSEKLTDWPGGGQVGIHGTNDPEGSIGKHVSKGCIRLRNEHILELTNFAPVGTPILIQE